MENMQWLRRKSSGNRNPPERDHFWVAAEAALRRAAYKARQRDIALTGTAVTYRDGKIVYDTEP